MGHSERHIARNPILRGAMLAFAAALSFGVTTPFIQRFGRGVGAFPTAALLYTGAALVSLRLARAKREVPIPRTSAPRLLLIAIFGAVLAPVCLAWGLQRTSATSASLLLNVEALATVVFAWLAYREPIGARVFWALLAMAGGGALLVAVESTRVASTWLGAAAVLVASIAWAVDNTLARRLSDFDPTQVVMWKGILGTVCGVALSLAFRQSFPQFTPMLGLFLCGATGYGLSLRLYLLAQRQIGAARTGSIFALAPFIGACVAWGLGDRCGGWATLGAVLLFAVGTYLHLSEVHEHRHTHRSLKHEHLHSHDDGHHDHVHDPPVSGEHVHAHVHDERTHAHAHGLDIHHRHRHPRHN